MKEIAQSLSDVSTIEQAPMMEGRTMLVVLAPGKPSAKKKEKAENPAEVREEAKE
ncbi:MAG: translation initiation factor IF-3 C-terminal domain-containing protein [Chloroflexi bacterium]|nr:translation initiation factor IF-3 C-terminal domain-containing protein [Chloroflexota bacterium]